jgi:hypothetical protein
MSKQSPQDIPPDKAHPPEQSQGSEDKKYIKRFLSSD